MIDKDLPVLEDASQPLSLRPLQFDAAKYLDYVEDPHLTEAQKIEFLQTLWTIMASFVDLGFGVDSVMPILEGRALESGQDALQETIPTHEFNVAADDAADEEIE